MMHIYYLCIDELIIYIYLFVSSRVNDKFLIKNGQRAVATVLQVFRVAGI